MTISLPTFKRDGNRYIQVAEGGAVKAANLMAKHSPTISRLKEKLGFERDETVIAWLLEQIELSPDLDKAIGKLLGNE
jgi:hypothetical protein